MNLKITLLFSIVSLCNPMVHGAGPQFLGLLQDFYAAPQDGTSRHSAIATMDLDGAIGELVPLAGERWSDVVVSRGGEYFAIEGDNPGSVYRFDPDTMNPLKVAVGGPGIPETPWLGGLTWDTTRDRLVVATLGNGGSFLEYSDATAWNLISSLHFAELRSIAYRSSNDLIYGLQQRFDAPINYLYRFGSDGTLLGRINLSQPIGADTPWGLDWQMSFASDGRLAVIGTEWVNDSFGNHTGITSRTYLIDPDTGLVDGQGVPEPGMLTMVLAGCGFLLMRRPRA